MKQIGAIGVLGGSLLTTSTVVITNSFTYRKEVKKAERERAWLLEDKARETNKKKEIKEFKVYNEALKIDGEFQFVHFNDDNGMKEFSIAQYKEKMRPILFIDFHLLNPEVRNLIRKLDDYAYADIHYGTWVDPNKQ
ncbi:hypothetical protein Back11_02430 [Paenibacillus baekrokdamisoli]|uniref:Uncharacterized protein n=1 Tax=Paenibacillus baekrokdamisoli TaxID=1712516 RepID=A0A3G9J5B6_9BACL|nr:hypothetical protein [Paenibacillus baekrokdamisoli]MBB3069125.1 hypothetical protein [Paenibacillus baekrokdamisoli]BBH18898.1 hypothetical protein Back11_02430 [Paenibacillus baekrokdamisoli]